jgi:hypothetical protein
MSARERFLLEPPHPLPADRAVRIALRTAHIAAFAVLFGGHFFDVDAERLRVWLWLTIGTGASLVMWESMGSFVWAYELRAWLTFAKLTLLCLVPSFWEQRRWILLAVLVIGSASSHMPSRLRHYAVFQRRIIHDPRKG